MSKDFMSLVDCGVTDRAGALRGYVSSQSVFYPPLPGYVKNDIIEAFAEYWLHGLELSELARRCWLKDVSSLYKYFDQFLDEG